MQKLLQGTVPVIERVDGSIFWKGAGADHELSWDGVGRVRK